jgi:hypothetical protein
LHARYSNSVALVWSAVLLLFGDVLAQIAKWMWGVV